MKPTLLVLAAGMGSRYGGLKQIDPVGPCGEVILDYSIHDAIRAGFGKVVFVIRKEIESDFRDTIGVRWQDRIDVAYAFQSLDDLPDGIEIPPSRQKPWGTTHAILAARNCIREPFGVINADDFYGPRSFQRLAGELSNLDAAALDFVLIGFPLHNTISENGTVSRGLCTLDALGNLAAIQECHEIRPVSEGIAVNRPDGPALLDGTQTVSMNMWGFTPVFFDRAWEGFAQFLKKMPDPLKSEYYIPTLVQDLIDSGESRVAVKQSDETWLGVTYPEDKPIVHAGLAALIDKGVYPRKL
ncbi:MAG: nucleotidyltransferase [Verrucomicrobia bacterium]|nr:nucleotidyltransferase [Verrucomicrobiota bacterium]MCH8514627.1 nucleotidyltransferase [Kiritimatiellia bacterium]